MKCRGDMPQMRYLFAKSDYIKYRSLMKTLSNSVKFDASDPAKFRLRVLEHFDRFGLQSTLHAFDVKKSTLYDWRKQYRTNQKRLVSLVPLSTRPHRVRVMRTDYRLIEFIRVFREEYGNVGKEVIKPFLDVFALELGVKSLGLTTIGKIIKRKGFTEKVKKNQRKPGKKRLRVRRSPRVSHPGLVEVDTIIICVDGKNYYFISVMDVYTKYALVKRVVCKSAKQARLVLQAFQAINPTPVHTIQTDNGSEFLGAFHDYLESAHIVHQFIYPRSPKVNGFIERFNRTVQEQCINRADELYCDLEAFDEKLATYIHWYNTLRPHSALKQLSPMQFINSQIPKCR